MASDLAKPQKISVVIAADVFSSLGQKLQNHFDQPLALVKCPSKSLISCSVDSLLNWPNCGKIFVLSKDQKILNTVKSEVLDTPFFDATNTACASVFLCKVAENAENYGDILRHIDGSGVAQEDQIIHEISDQFVFVQGPYVKLSNNLVEAYDKHVERVKISKKSSSEMTPAMTLLFKQADEIDEISCCLYGEEEPSYKILKLTTKLDAAKEHAFEQMKHQKITANATGDNNDKNNNILLDSEINVPTDELNQKISTKNSKVKLISRTDLVESHIAILSKNIAVAYGENRTWPDFNECVKTQLAQEELYQKQTNFFIGKDIELEPIESVFMFRRVLMRKCLSQSCGYDSHLEDFETNDFNSYFHVDACLENTDLITGSWIDKEVTIEDRTTLTSCQVFENCQIGKDCILDNCTIGKDVIIGENCRMRNCFIAEGTVIKNGSTILNKEVTENQQLTPLTRYPKIEISEADLHEFYETKSQLSSVADQDMDTDDEEEANSDYYEESSSDDEDNEICAGGWSDEDDVDFIDTKEVKECMKIIKELLKMTWPENIDGFNNLNKEMRQTRARFKEISVIDMIRLIVRTLIKSFDSKEIKDKVKGNIRSLLKGFHNDINVVEDLILQGISEQTQLDANDEKIDVDKGQPADLDLTFINRGVFVMQALHDIFENDEKVSTCFKKNPQLGKSQNWVKFVEWIEDEDESSSEDEESSEAESSEEEESESEEESSED